MMGIATQYKRRHVYFDCRPVFKIQTSQISDHEISELSNVYWLSLMSLYIFDGRLAKNALEG